MVRFASGGADKSLLSEREFMTVMHLIYVAHREPGSGPGSPASSAGSSMTSPRERTFTCVCLWTLTMINDLRLRSPRKTWGAPALSAGDQQDVMDLEHVVLRNRESCSKPIDVTFAQARPHDER
jgi:hypothetical protein